MQNCPPLHCKHSRMITVFGTLPPLPLRSPQRNFNATSNHCWDRLALRLEIRILFSHTGVSRDQSRRLYNASSGRRRSRPTLLRDYVRPKPGQGGKPGRHSLDRVRPTRLRLYRHHQGCGKSRERISWCYRLRGRRPRRADPTPANTPREVQRRYRRRTQLPDDYVLRSRRQLYYPSPAEPVTTHQVQIDRLTPSKNSTRRRTRSSDQVYQASR